MPSSSNVYMAADAKAMKAEAARLDYKIKITENNGQTQEDQQVQQFIATGQKPAAIVYWPSTASAGINSARLLSRVAPVIQMNQPVLPKEEEYITAYAGADNTAIGKQMGKDALTSVAAEKKSGVKFHGAGGKPNLIHITFTAGYQGGIDRKAGFSSVAGDAFDVLSTQPASNMDAQTGYAAASQLIPKFKSKGIDYVLCDNNDIAVGVIKALRQNGLTPGKDVTIIAGDLSGNKEPMRKGEVASAIVQSPVIEGQLVIDTVAKYLAAGKTRSGSYQYPAAATKPALTTKAPYTTNLIPNPMVTKKTLDSITIWGMKIDKLVV